MTLILNSHKICGHDMNNELGSTNQVNANTNVMLLQTFCMQFATLLHLRNAKLLRVKKMLFGLFFVALVFKSRYCYT